MKKYEITVIPHPQYPWLHRIRALYSFRDDVQPGQLGGFVEYEVNLSQDGTCWLFDDAIACEYAYVSQQAVLKDHAVAKGWCLVGGLTVCEGNALVCDNAFISNGILTDCCLVGGNACLYRNKRTGISPKVSGHAIVYGDIGGAVHCHGFGVVLPGMEINNPTFDMISVSHLGVQVDIAWNDGSRNILPPDDIPNAKPDPMVKCRQAKAREEDWPKKDDAR